MSNNNNKYRICGDLSNGKPPRDSATSNSTISNISKTCSLTSNVVNCAAVLTSVVGVGDQTIDSSDVVKWNNTSSAVSSGLSVSSASLIDATLTSRSVMVFDNPVVNNVGFKPFDITVDSVNGPFQVSETGFYGVSCKVVASYVGSFITSPHIILAPTDDPTNALISSSYIGSIGNLRVTLSGLTMLTANTDYQISVNLSGAPTAVTLEPGNSLHIIRFF